MARSGAFVLVQLANLKIIAYELIFKNYPRTTLVSIKEQKKSSNIKKQTLLNRVYGEIRSFCSCSARRDQNSKATRGTSQLIQLGEISIVGL